MLSAPGSAHVQGGVSDTNKPAEEPSDIPACDASSLVWTARMILSQQIPTPVDFWPRHVPGNDQ